MNELALIADADVRARAYSATVGERRVFPGQDALDGLAAFAEPLPERGVDAVATLAMLDDIGSPSTVVSNGPRYLLPFVLSLSNRRSAQAGDPASRASSSLRAKRGNPVPHFQTWIAAPLRGSR